MAEEKKLSNGQEGGSSKEQYSLNDDRRVKVLSPGAMVAKRFFRNRLAIVGLTVLIVMFLFSFLGGVVSPYRQDQIFYADEIQMKSYANVTENTEYRYMAADGQKFGGVLQGQSVLAIQKGGGTFNYKDVDYVVTKEGEEFFSIATADGEAIGIAYMDVVSASNEGDKLSYEFTFGALKAYTNGANSFSADGSDYELGEDGSVMKGNEEVAYVSRYVILPSASDVFLSRSFKEELQEALAQDVEEFAFTNPDGETNEYTITYDAYTKSWTVLQETFTHIFDRYSFPTKEHWLGTDGNGMDMLTRLMYGGRVSLIIGFIVVFIEAVLGIVLGGISGYFGGWVDNLIMRIVDVFYCIPSYPILIILGAAMDGMRMDSQTRMVYMMLLLGFLGWPSIARMVRGQILSLREQEFMTATEACGISASRRIFRHLVPNVIPQLIVICTMGLGSTIITEATLSFLGLGVKFPFASWGNIISDVNNTHVLTNYWFIWIPAGICLLVTVLAFNLVGDGLRDAFDPRMKR